jgi:hypothetical protein
MTQAGPAVAVTDTLDQATQTETWTDNWRIGGGYRPQMAQIVTAGQYGFIDRVSVYLDNLDASDPVTVQIQTVVGGVPSGTVLGSGMIPVSALSYTPTWVSAKISGTLSLSMIPGTQYAIVLSSGGGTIEWYSSGDVYARGHMLVNEGNGWTHWTIGDAMFQAYVIPDTLDQSQSQTGFYRQLGGTPVGQTFTVGQYGILDRVSVYLSNSSSSPAPIAVVLRTVTSDGLPTTTQVASGTITADALPSAGFRGWATAGISPLIVSPGDKYALLLSTSVNGAGWVLASDLYPGGSLVVKNGTGWTVSPYDAAFETRVIPPILDQQQTVFDRSLGICPEGGCSIRINSKDFIPGWTGILRQVSVALELEEGGATSVLVNILDGREIVIGSGTIPGPFNSYNPRWEDATMSGVTASSLQVSAGDKHYISVEPSGGWIWWAATGMFQFTHKTYMLPVAPITFGPPWGPPVITPCANGVCPAASGGFTPADLTDGNTSHFQFRERPNGTIQGTLTFTNPSPDGIALKGCTTESAACRLTVATFACTDQHAMTVAGTYTPMGEAAGTYRLTLSGARDGIGTFTLAAGGSSFTLTQDGIVDVTCPPVRGDKQK